MRTAVLVAAAGVAASADVLTSADLRRAWQQRPYSDSHVSGATHADAFVKMNRHLRAQRHVSSPCEEWRHESLNELSRRLYGLRNGRLGHAYASRNDKRAMHFDSLDYKEQLWSEEQRQAAGSEEYNVTRDGKCAEAVMWWTHHLPAATRQRLASEPGFVLPLMPARGPVESVNKEYIFQIQCSTCHTQKQSVAAAEPLAARKQFPMLGNTTKCPIDPKTGLPTVFYNRTKRCDWDFDPPCEPCEGIGGYIWGSQAEDIVYTTCKKVAKAEDIPADNITSPLWPKQFTAMAFNNQIDQRDEGGPFPGADACDTSKTYELQYSQYYSFDDSLPIAAIQQLSNFKAPPMGKNAGANVSINIWHLPSTNMFIETINPATNSTLLCQCVGVFPNGNHSANPLGPLHANFAKDAVLIGREKIGLEASETTSPPTSGIATEVVADHWILGPHHFWVDVASNQMVRGWQPFNALQVFYNWGATPPTRADNPFKLTQSCRDHYTANLTCSPEPGVPSKGIAPVPCVATAGGSC
eukprot:TRINITY_DN469_c0_g1_i3.p2 TRINITY_DN469_c0_g1~~TRINITY_DN469_c0_g1_i3.p2  ORF type:complete len:525 (+),score=225.63 TRINITY_DN469_c0_g1_i3:76-1650(+)